MKIHSYQNLKMKQTLKSVDFNQFWRFWPFITLAKFDFSYGHQISSQKKQSWLGVKYSTPSIFVVLCLIFGISLQIGKLCLFLVITQKKLREEKTSCLTIITKTETILLVLVNASYLNIMELTLKTKLRQFLESVQFQF